MLYMLILQQALRIPQTQFNDSLYTFLLTDPYKRGPGATQVKITDKEHCDLLIISKGKKIRTDFAILF